MVIQLQPSLLFGQGITNGAVALKESDSRLGETGGSEGGEGGSKEQGEGARGRGDG